MKKKEKWYDTDWFVCIVVGASIVIGIVSNYLTHGYIAW